MHAHDDESNMHRESSCLLLLPCDRHFTTYVLMQTYKRLGAWHVDNNDTWYRILVSCGHGQQSLLSAVWQTRGCSKADVMLLYSQLLMPFVAANHAHI